MIELKPGQHIFYRNEDYIDDLEFVVLDSKPEVYYCISANLLPRKMRYDPFGKTVWFESQLYRYLYDFGKERLFNTNNVHILSEDRYKQYQKYVPKYKYPYWLSTQFFPMGVCFADSPFMKVVDTSGLLVYAETLDEMGVAICIDLPKERCDMFTDKQGKIVVQYNS